MCLRLLNLFPFPADTEKQQKQPLRKSAFVVEFGARRFYFYCFKYYWGMSLGREKNLREHL